MGGDNATDTFEKNHFFTNDATEKNSLLIAGQDIFWNRVKPTFSAI